MKIIIIGGVAGGASCAARLRRLDEKAQILMVERGPYVSFANCGLPYHVGNVIEKESSLLIGSEQMFKGMFGIDCRINCEAIAIHAAQKTVDLRDTKTGAITTETYDKPVTRAVVVGGGFIGLETAENLIHRGFEVTLIQKGPQLLGPLDPEIACLVEGHMQKHGLKLVLDDGVAGFKQLEGGAIEVQTSSWNNLTADVVILAIGVRPETSLA
jgi:NADPH-dependent 2,4-dienoyl-CoA reductase/sulfur reductase-like enzyme